MRPGRCGLAMRKDSVPLLGAVARADDVAGDLRRGFLDRPSGVGTVRRAPGAGTTNGRAPAATRAPRSWRGGQGCLGPSPVSRRDHRATSLRTAEAALRRRCGPATLAPERGRSSEVERQLPKLNVVGSIPIARSIPQVLQLELIFCGRRAWPKTRPSAASSVGSGRGHPKGALEAMRANQRGSAWRYARRRPPRDQDERPRDARRFRCPGWSHKEEGAS